MPGETAIRCKDFIETLGDYLSGELAPERKTASDLHLRVCGECVRYLRSYEVTIRLGKAAFDGDEEGTPDELVEVILSSRPKSR